MKITCTWLIAAAFGAACAAGPVQAGTGSFHDDYT